MRSDGSLLRSRTWSGGAMAMSVSLACSVVWARRDHPFGRLLGCMRRKGSPLRSLARLHAPEGGAPSVRVLCRACAMGSLAEGCSIAPRAHRSRALFGNSQAERRSHRTNFILRPHPPAPSPSRARHSSPSDPSPMLGHLMSKRPFQSAQPLQPRVETRGSAAERFARVRSARFASRVPPESPARRRADFGAKTARSTRPGGSKTAVCQSESSFFALNANPSPVALTLRSRRLFQPGAAPGFQVGASKRSSDASHSSIATSCAAQGFNPPTSTQNSSHFLRSHRPPIPGPPVAPTRENSSRVAVFRAPILFGNEPNAQPERERG